MLRRGIRLFRVTWLKSPIVERLLLTGAAAILIASAVTSLLLPWQACRAPVDSGGTATSTRIGAQETPKRPYLGITYVPITTPMAASHGLAVNSGILVTAVAVASPAHKAGILADDIIVEFAGKWLTHEITILDILNQHAAGHAVQVGVVRNGDQRNLEVTLASQPGS